MSSSSSPYANNPYGYTPIGNGPKPTTPLPQSMFKPFPPVVPITQPTPSPPPSASQQQPSTRIFNSFPLMTPAPLAAMYNPITQEPSLPLPTTSTTPSSSLAMTCQASMINGFALVMIVGIILVILWLAGVFNW